MLQSDIITKLRDDYGFTDVSVYPDSKLIELINYALMKISDIYPKIMRDTFQTVANQTRYTITKTGLIGIKEIFYSTSSGGFGAGNLGSTYNPSSQLTSILSMEIAAHLQPSGAEVVGHDTFDLIPTPEEVMTVYFDYKTIRSLTELPANFEEDVLDLVAYRNSEIKFKRANSVSGLSGNPYKFDRRGNITEEPTSMIVETQRALKTDYDNICKRIQTKVNKL